MKSHSRLSQPNSISLYARTTVAAALLILGAAMFSIAASGGGSSGSAKPSASTDNFQKGPALDKSSVSVQYNALYHPVLSESHKIINAANAWNAAGGRSHAGAGIKIGDIDSGIDETHPFFDPSGFSYPSGFPKCDAADSSTHKVDQNCEHVSPKVIVAK